MVILQLLNMHWKLCYLFHVSNLLWLKHSAENTEFYSNNFSTKIPSNQHRQFTQISRIIIDVYVKTVHVFTKKCFGEFRFFFQPVQNTFRQILQMHDEFLLLFERRMGNWTKNVIYNTKILSIFFQVRSQINYVESPTTN